MSIQREKGEEWCGYSQDRDAKAAAEFEGLDWGPGRRSSGCFGGEGWNKAGRSKAAPLMQLDVKESEIACEQRSWIEWSSSGVVPIRAARAIFRIDQYTSKKMLEIK